MGTYNSHTYSVLLGGGGAGPERQQLCCGGGPEGQRQHSVINRAIPALHTTVNKTKTIPKAAGTQMKSTVDDDFIWVPHSHVALRLSRRASTNRRTLLALSHAATSSSKRLASSTVAAIAAQPRSLTAAMRCRGRTGAMLMRGGDSMATTVISSSVHEPTWLEPNGGEKRTCLS